MACRRYIQLISESMHRDLSRMERLSLRCHLIICTACRRYHRQLRLIRELLRRLNPEDALSTARLDDDARARIRQVIASKS